MNKDALWDALAASNPAFALMDLALKDPTAYERLMQERFEAMDAETRAFYEGLK